MYRFTLIIALLLVACSQMPLSNSISFVAVGDSYTEGTGIDPQFAWPTLLAEHLKQDGYDFVLTENLGRSGWTSADAVQAQLPRFVELNPNFGTLFIGANDVFQNIPVETFEKNLHGLIEGMLSVLPSSQRLVIITIPDYSLTPAGMVYGRGRDIAAQLDAFNDVIKAAAAKHNLPLADIHSLSTKVVFDIGLVSEDNLHPSERGHQLWEELIYKTVRQALHSDL